MSSVLLARIVEQFSGTKLLSQAAILCGALKTDLLAHLSWILSSRARVSEVPQPGSRSMLRL